MMEETPNPYCEMPTASNSNILPKSITFVVTEACNLKCNYCYLVHKNTDNRMPFDVAQKAVDYILENRQIFTEPSAHWDFIGGEPFLEVSLIEQIMEYIRLRTYELDHPWFTQSTFGTTTNGTLYGTPKVQAFITKYKESFGVSMTVDGPKHVHDMVRVFKDGSGSYDTIAANMALWREQYPHVATKVTIAHENLPYLAECILHLFDLNIGEIHANVVFEDAWQKGDDEILEQQLDCLADAMIEKGLWRDHTCSFFNRTIGYPQDVSRENGNWCGAGKMLAIDAKGNFYPCNRFLGFSLEIRPPRMVGNIYDGIHLNRVRPFLALTRSSQSSKECLECDVASGCAWCQGYNYDQADSETIYQRAIHICNMHKARVRANKRFWSRVDQAEAEDKA